LVLISLPNPSSIKVISRSRGGREGVLVLMRRRRDGEFYGVV
jgi:hypothetical protein